MIPFRDDVPAKRYPVTTAAIILANLLIFLYQGSLSSANLQQLISVYGFTPAAWQLSSSHLEALPSLAPLSLISSMFLHGGWLHLIGNMWYLWIFGDNVEDRMGHFRFLFFYLICGLAAHLVHMLSASSSTLPCIGASGAVAGVLGAYLISYPFARVLTLIPLFFLWPIIELPAVLLLGTWFFIQFFEGASMLGSDMQTVGGIAWWAHVGGFLAGLILVKGFALKPSRR